MKIRGYCNYSKSYPETKDEAIEKALHEIVKIIVRDKLYDIRDETIGDIGRLIITLNIE